MEIPVWVYWEGPRPDYIDLCIETIRKQCKRSTVSELHVVDRKSLMVFIDSDVIHEGWREIPDEGIVSDCVRAALLTTHGGVYLDADTVCLRDPAELYQETATCYATWDTKVPWRAIAGYVASPANVVMEKWLWLQNKSIAEGKTGWMDLGEVCLTPAIQKYPDETRPMPRRLVLPVDIDSNVEAFFKPGKIEDYTLAQTVCFGLNHSYMISRHYTAMKKSREQRARSPLLIDRVLTYAQELVDGT